MVKPVVNELSQEIAAPEIPKLVFNVDNSVLCSVTSNAAVTETNTVG